MDAPALTLEEAVTHNSKVISDIRCAVLKAVFSTDEQIRKAEINYLNSQFGGFLRRCYVRDLKIFFDVNSDGNPRKIFVQDVPEKYADIGSYNFEI